MARQSWVEGTNLTPRSYTLFCITMVQIKMLKSCTGVRDELDLCERKPTGLGKD